MIFEKIESFLVGVLEDLAMLIDNYLKPRFQLGLFSSTVNVKGQDTKGSWFSGIQNAILITHIIYIADETLLTEPAARVKKERLVRVR